MTVEPKALECTRRHLSLVRWDYEEHRKSLSGDAAKRKVREADRELLDRVSRQFDKRDLAPPGYLDVLRGGAAPVIEIDPGDLERVWRAASGAAHGKRWPSLALQSIVPLNVSDPGQHWTLAIPDADGMTEVLRFADRMVTYGVLRHADFCGADIPRLMREARRWLVDAVSFAEDADPAVIAHLNREDDRGLGCPVPAMPWVAMCSRRLSARHRDVPSVLENLGDLSRHLFGKFRRH